MNANRGHETKTSFDRYHAAIGTRIMVRAFIIFLLVAVALEIFVTSVVAANNPGHDSLYILRSGDTVTGTFNVTGNMIFNSSIVCTSANGFCSQSLSTAGGWTNTSTTTSTTLNVNVGTTDVNSTDTVYTGLGSFIIGRNTAEFINLTQDASNLRVELNGKNSYIDTIGNFLLQLGTNRTQAMTIDTSQNVGIGTVSPSQKLVVSGTANVTGATYLGNTACGANQVLTTNSAGLISCVADQNSGGSGNGSVTSITAVGPGLLGGNTTIAGTITLNETYTNATYAIKSTESNDNTSQANIITTLTTTESNDNTSQAALINAKTSPANCAAGTVVQNTTTGGVQCIAATGTVTSITRGFGFNASGTSITTTGTLDINSTYLDTLYVNEGQANSVTSAMITNGAVTNLDVGSGAVNYTQVNTTNAGSGGQVLTYGSAGQFTWAADQVGASSSNAGGWTNTSTNTTTLLNVGIGTTAPTTALDVNGAGRFQSNTAPTSGAGTEIQYNSATGTGVILAYDRTGSAYKNISLNNVIRVDGTTNNVGIGTTSPATALDIKGNISLTRSDGTSYPNVLSIGGAANDVTLSGGLATGNINFFTSTSGSPIQRVIITSAGNVGINTTSPNATLDVRGGVMIEGGSSTCASTNRGEIKLVTGNPDKMYACLKDSGSSYNWVLLGRGD